MPDLAQLCVLRWARLDSNQGPTDYESRAGSSRTEADRDVSLQFPVFVNGDVSSVSAPLGELCCPTVAHHVPRDDSASPRSNQAASDDDGGRERPVPLGNSLSAGEVDVTHVPLFRRVLRTPRHLT